MTWRMTASALELIMIATSAAAYSFFGETRANYDGLCPFAAGRLANSVIEISEQPADHVPAVAAAHFDVSLKVDPHEASLGQPRGFQLLGCHLIGVEDLHQFAPRHFNELHDIIPCSLRLRHSR